MSNDNHDVPEWATTVFGVGPDGKKSTFFTQFSAAGDINSLLQSFIDMSIAVTKEIGIDIPRLLSELQQASESHDIKDELLRKKIDSTVKGAEADLLRRAGPDLVYLYMSSTSALTAIRRGETEAGAWMAVIAAEIAFHLSLRGMEPALMAGYKQAVLAPAKKREWYPDLVKAAERLRKNGVPDKSIVGILREQFPDKSPSTLYRVLKREGFSK
jgi:hypothetical protein